MNEHDGRIEFIRVTRADVFTLENVNDEENTNDRLTRWHGWTYARKEGAYSLVNHSAGLNTSTLLFTLM